MLHCCKPDNNTHPGMKPWWWALFSRMILSQWAPIYSEESLIKPRPQRAIWCCFLGKFTNYTGPFTILNWPLTSQPAESLPLYSDAFNSGMRCSPVTTQKLYILSTPGSMGLPHGWPEPTLLRINGWVDSARPLSLSGNSHCVARSAVAFRFGSYFHLVEAWLPFNVWGIHRLRITHLF